MKNIINFVIALILIIILSPIILATIIIIIFSIGFPVFFIQERIGLNNKPFNLYKLRTMNNKKDLQGNILPDGERLTKVGQFLRKTSLDELPQLFNVLKGEMNIVGPRPLLVRYLPYYSEEERERHNVKPGITGLAQISGRNQLDWESRLGLDVAYVNQQSLMLDLKIIIKTISQVLKRDGVANNPSEILLDLDIDRHNKK